TVALFCGLVSTQTAFEPSLVGFGVRECTGVMMQSVSVPAATLASMVATSHMSPWLSLPKSWSTGKLLGGVEIGSYPNASLRSALQSTFTCGRGLSIMGAASGPPE